METFLGRVASALLSAHGEHLSDVTVIFPNRRAGVFLAREISRQAGKPVFAPTLLSFTEFLEHTGQRELPDRLSLICCLYAAYLNFYPEETFDEFFAWGEILLTDFEDLDKHGLDAQRVYTHLADLEQIDQAFPLELEDLPRLKAFWATLTGNPPAGLGAEFLAVWKILAPLYQAFHARLAEPGWATEGWLTRTLAAKIAAGEPLQLPTPYLAFAGFNALTPAEQTILKGLAKDHNAMLFWDGDPWYVNTLPHHQAGHFLRQLKRNFNIDGQLEIWFEQSAKEIEAIGVSLHVGQAKVAGQLVTELLEKQPSLLESIAVVLPDERLLFPLLHSLPPELAELNVTMGYPLRQTQLYRWVEAISALQLHARTDSAGAPQAFYHRDLTTLLLHPYSQYLLGEQATELLTQLRRDAWAYVPLRVLESLPGLVPYLAALTQGQAILGMLLQSLQEVYQAQLVEDPEAQALEKAYLLEGYTQLLRLQETFVLFGIELSPASVWRLIEQVLGTVRIPFTGEPLKGLQVMGFLETRALDFDTVILLSANEGYLPPTRPQTSFIPYGLRKTYGLPTQDEADAVNAYHTYRLLQRAKQVFLLYDTTGEHQDAEPSRYLLQLKYELAPLLPNIHFTESHASAEASLVPSPAITVEKTPEVISKLSEWLELPDAPARHALYPSDLNAYVTCPLRLYFRKIAGLPEPDEIADEIDNRMLGNILHKALQLSYEGFVGKTITKSDLEALRPALPEIVERAVHAELSTSASTDSGINYLVVEVIERLLRDQLEQDIAATPFELLAVEEKLKASFSLTDGKVVALAGRVDRIDRQKGTVRVIDYKTGGHKQLGKKDPFLSQGNANALQLRVYEYLYRHAYPEDASEVKAGIFWLRYKSKELEEIKEADGSPVSYTVFELGLERILTQLFDPAVPFAQVKGKHCDTCAYYRLCYQSLAPAEAAPQTF